MPSQSNTEMKLDDYFRRINYQGPSAPDLNTLTALHRAHLIAIAYENFDIHLGRTLSLDLRQIYDKIVQRGRGGWCYEMNSLFAWALRELGFEVQLLGAAVGPTLAIDRQHLDHLVLCARLDEPPDNLWLLDAGFGNGFLEPLPLREGIYQQAHHNFQLRRDGDYWRFKNHVHTTVGFDFLLQPRTIEEFGTRCNWLQTAPESPFTKAIVCHRLQADHSIFTLRGAVLTTIDRDGKTQKVIDTLDEYQEALTNLFKLRLSNDEIAHLWQKVWVAHLAWVESGA